MVERVESGSLPLHQASAILRGKAPGGVSGPGDRDAAARRVLWSLDALQRVELFARRLVEAQDGGDVEAEQRARRRLVEALDDVRQRA